MSEKHNPKADGIYAGYFTGSTGMSFGIFLFKDGAIAGADAGEAIYDGKFEITNDEQHIVGEVEFNIPIGSQTITGIVAESEPIHFTVPIKLPVEIDPHEVIRIETPGGPVNAKFRKLRAL